MSIKQNIIAQFKRPHGYMGHLAGLIMANRPSNIERNDWTLSLLELKSQDIVLEIGFGPGIAIEKAARQVSHGLIVGVDHSETMLHQASRRNANAIQQGKVKLFLGTIYDLPDSDLFFDKIYSANVVQFWEDPEKEFARLYALLTSGGKIATTYMPRHRGATNSDAQKKAGEIASYLHAVGYKNVHIMEKPMRPLAVICVLAEK